MNIKGSRWLVWVVAVVSGAALAAGVVSNTLSVQRIVAQPDGSERREAAATAHPGDVLEYAVDFRNAGSTAVHALQATLPIPVGVTLLPATVHPAGALASVDGATYAAMPLMRRVRGSDGNVTEEAVPLGEYRSLRWAPAELAANGSLSVSARVVLVK